MIRKVLVVKTKGSRREGNLKPIITERLPRGVNLNVLKYIDNDTKAIVEIWGTEHPLYRFPVKSSDIERLCRDESVIDVFDSIDECKYLNEDERERIKREVHYEVGVNAKLFKHDLETRKILFMGREHNFVKKKIHRGVKVLVLDEG